jgi:exosortase/archaeosortase family protein
MRLEVAEACSGIRSIVSLLAFALVLGELGDGSTRHRALLACATIPIAVCANAARVAATGLAADAWGMAAAQGFLHTTSGVAVFAIAVAALLVIERVVTRFHLPLRRGAAA